MSFRPGILDELIRRDGLQGNTSLPQCASCVEEVGKYRCTNCTTPTLYCAPCIVHQHESLPLHRLEVCLLFTSQAYIVSSSDRSGMERFLSACLSKTWTIASISAINMPPAHRPIRILKLCSSLTSTGSTISMYNSVLVLG